MAIKKRALLPMAVAVTIAVLGACSSTGSPPSASTVVPSAASSGPVTGGAMCEDAAALRSDLADLKGLDLKAVGKDGLTAAIGKVEASITTLATSAKDVAGPQVEALTTALASLKTALGNVTSDASVAEKSADIQAAVGEVEVAATALKSALTQCS